jgi:anti-anti-sigma factor
MPAVIDSTTASQLRQLLTLSLEGYRELVLDCSDVELVKSCTVALLVALRRRCASRGVELQLIHASAATREFLFMTGLHRIISAHDSRPAIRPIRSAVDPRAA